MFFRVVSDFKRSRNKINSITVGNKVRSEVKRALADFSSFVIITNAARWKRYDTMIPVIWYFYDRYLYLGKISSPFSERAQKSIPARTPVTPDLKNSEGRFKYCTVLQTFLYWNYFSFVIFSDFLNGSTIILQNHSKIGIFMARKLSENEQNIIK